MINQDRLLTDLKRLGEIGYIDGCGTNRVAYSKEYFEGASFVTELMKQAGLEVRTDSVGNIFGRKPGNGTKGTILIASHIDTVPGGGIYDGCLGVIGGIEIIRAMEEDGYVNNHDIEIAAFIEEEGNAVGGTFGSRCFTGMPVTEAEKSKAQGFGVTPSDIVSARGDMEQYAAYYELHIEQGGILEHEGMDIGVVEGIVGIDRYRCHVSGQANHAGTTPMNLRKDAMHKTSEILIDLYESVEREDSMVCTVGVLEIENGAVNIIPASVAFTLELRDPNPALMQKLAADWSDKHMPEGLVIEPLSSQKETHMDENLTEALAAACEEMGLRYKRMFSGAGHDAMNLAFFVPSSMIFIPSVDGISHNPKEYSKPEAIRKGAELLYEAMKKTDQ